MADQPTPPSPDDRTPLHGPADPELERRIRAVMGRQADRIRPGDRYADILGEASRQRTGQRWLWPVVAAAAIALLAGVIGVPRLIEANRPAPSVQVPAATQPAPVPSPASTSPGASVSPEPSASDSARTEAVGVYYLASTVQRTETGAETDRVRLFREFHRMPGSPTRLAKVAGAITAMATTPPLDPDYRTAWTTLGAVEVSEVGGGLQIDLAADGFPAGLPDSFTAVQAIQQLVWTATAAYGKSVPVTVLVDGGTNVSWGRNLFGTPVSRDPNLQSPVWILDPVTDQRDQAGVVTVNGISTATEATIGWQVRDADTGDVVFEGSTTGGANGEYAPFEFDVRLKAGTYTVVVFAPDLSGQNPLGEGDSKTWVVD